MFSNYKQKTVIFFCFSKIFKMSKKVMVQTNKTQLKFIILFEFK
jgi:hypothetical protein